MLLIPNVFKDMMQFCIKLLNYYGYFIARNYLLSSEAIIDNDLCTIKLDNQIFGR